MFAQSIHVLLEGLAIGIIFAYGREELSLGFAFAIVSHEIPQEIGEIQMLLDYDLTVKETTVYNGLVKSISLIGS